MGAGMTDARDETRRIEGELELFMRSGILKFIMKEQLF